MRARIVGGPVALIFIFLFSVSEHSNISSTGIRSLSLILLRESKRGIKLLLTCSEKKRTKLQSIFRFDEKSVDENGFWRIHGIHNNNNNVPRHEIYFSLYFDALRYCSERRQ